MDNNNTKVSHQQSFSAWHEVWELISLFGYFLGLCAAGLLLLAKCSLPVHASESFNEIDRLDAVQQGSLLFKTEQGRYRTAPTLHTEVEIEVTGLIARAKVRQRFENTDDQWVEGVYVFPLPEDAAVDHMRMEIGERIIEGQIKERTVAKRIYKKAKSEGKKASLIEQERPNLFTNSVANIGPKETVVIEIEYQQVLRYNQSAFTLRFPMAMTPRYIPGTPIQSQEEVTQFNSLGWAIDTDQVPDASRITPPVVEGEDKVNPITLTVNLNAGFPLAHINSPTHAIKNDNKDISRGMATITLTDNTVFSDRDFELSWAPVASKAPRAALFTEQTGSELYHLLMMLPPDVQQAQQTLSREVIYVIDTSGSMGGASIEQARQALQLALKRLRPTDRFNVIQFNSRTHQLFDTAQSADFYHLQKARGYVGSLQAGGGTEMRAALEAALSNQQESHRVRQVIFLTDGSVGNEDALFKIIDRKLGQSRLFTIGIGSAPNSHFMNKAAQFGRGTYTYINNVSEVQEKMTALFQKLDAPMMSNIKLDSHGEQMEIYPQRLPDLYQGEPLIIAAKSSTAIQAVTISGNRQQQQWTNNIKLQNGIHGQDVGILWARRKIADLMDLQRQGANKDHTRKQIIDVAMQHHLVSKYTSLVAVDVTPTRPQEENLDTRALPLNLPHGQVREKIFGTLPQTATVAPLNLLIGGMLLLLALVLAKPNLRRMVQ
jgi:Ca-activated chloride channel family protein